MPEEKSKQIGIWICTALVLGNMIGSGIFLLPSALGEYGGISVVGWIFTSAGAICLAMVFGMLARISPRPGGPFAYTNDGLGRFAGFLVAWGHWIGVWTGNAAIAVAFTSYLTVFWPYLAEAPLAAIGVTLALIWLLTFVNILGIRSAGIVQLITTVLKILPIVAVATLGLLYVNTEHFTPFNASGESNFTAITTTAALTLWAYLGLESATVPAGNVKNPSWTIPASTVFGTVLAALLYILSTIAIIGILDPATLVASNAPFADAAAQVWGEWAYYAVGAGAIISCLGALNGWMILQSQVPMAAAEAGLFPPIFARKNKDGTPVIGIVISSLAVSVLMMMNYTKGLVEMFTFIILLATLTTLIPYIFSALAQMMILIRYKKVYDKAMMIKHLTYATLAFLYSLWAIAGAGQETVYWGLLVLFAGVPMFVVLQWKQNIVDVRQVLEEDAAASDSTSS